MAPLVQMFSAASLPEHVRTVNHNFKEKARKGEPIDLTKCALFEMVQYSCNPPQESIPVTSAVVCKPVVRLFRRCADGLTVETTAWEPIRLAEQDKTTPNDTKNKK